MLTINTIHSGVKNKEEYYTEDESLAKGESVSKDNGSMLTTAVVYGKGAEALGLSGQLNQSDFKSLFYGFKPGTDERIRGENSRPDNQERLAIDLTFSAPKSVSIALHLNQDERLFSAHTQAVQEVLVEVERRYIQTRIQVNGKRSAVNSGNLTAALIPHHTSRDGDMQLHTHAVIFNGTQGEDGKWRGLHNNEIYRQKWLGQLYRHKLAKKVQDLGYEIDKTKDGFELKGFSREDIKVFSKRSQAIIGKLEQQGKEINSKNKDEATLTTRKNKRHNRSLREYQQLWKNEAKENGITAPSPQENPVALLEEDVSKALDSAISHLTERSVSFTSKDTYEYVLKNGVGYSFTLDELDEQIETNQRLIPLNNQSFTTVEATKREIETVQRWMKGQGKASPLMSNPDLTGTKLNSGQAQAIANTLTSTDTHQIIHGLSGVGKTTALGVLREQLRGSSIEIKGFSPTIKAAHLLQEELGIKTNTVQHLVLGNPESTPHQLWIIDEAGLVSAKQMEAIGHKAESVGARILLVGDKGQNSSVEAGSPLRSLIDHGATTNSISKIIRQQNSTQKQAVEFIAHGYGSEALELLNKNGYVTEIEDRDERARSVAKQYLALSLPEREKTLIVTGTNKERLNITQAIRQGLKAEGELRESVQAVQLVSRNLTKEQSQHLHNYEVGDFIKLHRDYKDTPLEKGKLYKVEGQKGNELVVSSYGGRIYRFNPSKFKDKQVFSSQQIEIAVGDRLRWTAGADKTKGQINGKQITVTFFGNTSMRVRDKNGKTQEVSLLQPMSVDYDLVSTSYRAQGLSKKRVIVSATNDPTSSLEPFYVKISRQVKELSVYTQNLEKLRKWVNRSNAQENPLELITIDYEQKQRPIGTSRHNLQTAPARPTESRDQGAAREDRISEQADQASNPHQLRENSLHHNFSSESIHRTVDPDNAESQRERTTRIDERTHGVDRKTPQQNPRYELNLSGYEANNSRHQAENITDRTDRREAQRLDQELYRDNSDIKFEFELPALERLSELATSISTSQAEDELVENLKQINKSFEQVDSQLRFSKLEVLASALEEWQLGQDLANAISALDPAVSSSSQQLTSSLDRLLSTEIYQFELEELASAVTDWQSQQQLADALSETTQILTKFNNSIGYGEESSPPLSFKFDGLSEVASEISDYQDRAVLIDAVHNLKKTLEEAEYRPELKEVAELVNSANYEQLLSDEGLTTKLSQLSEAIESVELSAPLNIQFERMQELADAIAQQQADKAIASHLEAFRAKAEAINSLVENQVNKILDHLHDNQLVSDSDNQQLQDQVKSIEEKRPLGRQNSFWNPQYPSEPPSHLKPHHWEEFKRSVIHPDLVELNAESLEGMAVHERLLSEKMSKMGSGQYVTVPMAKEMRKYEQVAEGGWWGDAGIDALSLVDLKPGEQPETTLWGCFKPDTPRIDGQKSAAKGTTKYRKYENPASTRRVPFLPQVSDGLAEKIYQKHGINPTADERKSGFWFVVQQHPEIPITITEGFKKTLSSLSQGQVTIGLTGVNHVYRSKDVDGNKLPKRELNPELAVFAEKNREFRFAYDQDTKTSTIVNVRRDMVRGIELLEEKGSKVKVLKWNPSDGKGLDDLIGNKGPSAYLEAHQEAIPSDLDKRTHYRTEFNKMAKKVHQEFGDQISQDRLNLEIYVRMAIKAELADGARVIGESDMSRLLKKEQPELVVPYQKAIAQTAGTYKRMSDTDTPDLDRTASQLVASKLAQFSLEQEQDFEQTRSVRRGKIL